MTESTENPDALADDVRIHVFREAAATAHVSQAAEISGALGRWETDVRVALHELAAAKVLILAPNDGNTWRPIHFVRCRRASALQQPQSSSGASASGTRPG